MYIKKIFIVLIVLCISIIPIVPQAFNGCSDTILMVFADEVNEGKDGDLTYCITSLSSETGDKTYASITKCESSAKGIITIPTAVEGVTVTEVERYAFSECSDITEVVVPFTVSKIGYRAFDNCTSLKKITIANKNCLIAEEGYDDNAVNHYSYNGEYTFPENAVLEGYAESRVQKYARNYARTFLDIETGEEIKYTKDDYEQVITFSGSGVLDQDAGELFALLYGYEATKIIIDSGFTEIDPCAFKDYTNLREISFTDESPNYEVFDGALYNKDMTELVYYPNAKKMTELPESIININPDALLYSEWYKEQPDGLVYVGDMLYKYKGEIPANSNIVIKEGTTSILSEALDDCKNIDSIVIPDTISSIAKDSLNKNYGNLTIIGKPYSAAEKFAQNNRIIFIDSENNVILNFENIDCLKYSINDNGVSIDYVDTHYYYDDNDNWLCKYNYDIEIPERIDGLPVVSIKKVHHFIESIILPSSLKIIEDSAFEYCKIEFIKIPDGTTTIGNSAFLGCNLKSIIIPNNVEIIGYNFYCSDLTDVYFSGTEEEWNNIDIKSRDGFKYATIHYNYVPVSGDVNDDGKFDIADVVLFQKWLLAVPDVKLANWKAADLCEDGRLDVFDLCLLKRMLVENS